MRPESGAGAFTAPSPPFSIGAQMWNALVAARRRLVRRRVVVVGLVALVGAFLLTRDVCLSLWIRGVDLPMCPDGDLRFVADLEAWGLRRGEEGTVTVSPRAVFVQGIENVGSASVSHATARLSLVDAKGTVTSLADEDRFEGQEPIVARVVLPAVPDGDYKLVAHVSSRLGETTIEAPLALYTPAKIHVLTDRPLYEAGNTVKFRAVAFRAKDLAPLDGRPGRWFVRDPTGQDVLEENVPAGAWGVVSGSLPLDAKAPLGRWTVQWISGPDSGRAEFTVAPFELPRFRVEATPDRTFHRPGQKPVVTGRVVYASGAPVAKAAVEVSWTIDGEWPAPPAWEERLPKKATADASGQFKLDVPEIPGDLRGKVRLIASLDTTDAAGDRVASSATVLLAEDGIDASTVTELASGLVEGSNNRLYVRVTDPSGETLSGADVRLRRAWDPRDEGLVATADEDGVAAFQLDPGPAVNVVVPPMPYRPPPPVEPVERGETHDLANMEDASLADQKALDGWLAPLAACTRFSEESAGVSVVVRVERTGAIAHVVTGDASTPLDRCVVKVVRGLRLPAGSERFLRVEFTFNSSGLPSFVAANEVLSMNDSDVSSDGLLAMGLLDARSCLSRDAALGELPFALGWSIRKGRRDLDVEAIPVTGTIALSAATTACIREKVSHLAFEEPPNADALGLMRLSLAGTGDEADERPQATTFLGYELKVIASKAGKDLGSTLVRLEPGAVPPMRLRVTPVLAEAGGEVAVELVRGPEFIGKLPEELSLSDGRTSVTTKIDEKARTGRFTLPPGAEGWWEVSFSGAVARVFVRSKAALAVAVASDKSTYAPGDKAKLAIATTSKGKGVQAAVGLFGVDQSLAQLASLRTADDFASLRAVPTMARSFDGLDAQALTTGRVQGAHAAAAIVLGINGLVARQDEERVATASQTAQLDTVAELTDAFYRALAATHERTRTWERTAPAGEQMKPATMAKLWNEALDALDKDGKPARDAFGRRLKLTVLPEDLLALVDPRLVVVDGTRLPEDVESWSAYVAKEKP